jgi:predicted DNA-binding transcriptional regulator YafY
MIQGRSIDLISSGCAIAIMVYSFARIGAVIQMKVGDYFVQGRRRWVRYTKKAARNTWARSLGIHVIGTVSTADSEATPRGSTDGNLELSLTLNSLEEIVPWILSWGKDCEVVKPVKLQRKLRSLSV